MNEIFSQIANVGFPAALCIYLLVRVEAKLDNLTVSITELTKVIEGIKKV
jgi:hypothetical protein